MATKNIRREALKILRDFEVAGERSTIAEIGVTKEAEPRAGTRLISTSYLKTPYILAIDSTVDDDTELLRDVILSSYPNAHGSFLRNPREDSFVTYGVRHKFRDTYVMELRPISTRLDKEVARRFPELTRSAIQKYIKAGYVQVDGQVVTKPSIGVTEADTLALAVPERADMSSSGMPILYIDDSVIVVDKPAGMLTHSKGVLNDEFTVADFFRRYTTHALGTSRPGIVHRLDRDTSGVIIGARTDEAAMLLKKQFANRTVRKRYSAVVDGMPKHSEAVIDLPIGRNPSAPSTFRVDSNGKPALTTYAVKASNGRQSLVELAPKTGRTHQLRVHMQYIGTPIAGDRVYGSTKSAPRLCLHAHELEITIPQAGRKVFTAPVPELFERLVND